MWEMKWQNHSKSGKNIGDERLQTLSEIYSKLCQIRKAKSIEINGNGLNVTNIQECKRKL